MTPSGVDSTPRFSQPQDLVVDALPDLGVAPRPSSDAQGGSNAGSPVPPAV